MSRLLLACLAAMAVGVLSGCDSSSGMTAEEEQSFAGGDRSGARSPEAQQGIADFAERYRQRNPSAGGPPANDRVPQGPPGGASSS